MLVPEMVGRTDMREKSGVLPQGVREWLTASRYSEEPLLVDERI